MLEKSEKRSSLREDTIHDAQEGGSEARRLNTNRVREFNSLEGLVIGPQTSFVFITFRLQLIFRRAALDFLKGQNECDTVHECTDRSGSKEWEGAVLRTTELVSGSVGRIHSILVNRFIRKLKKVILSDIMPCPYTRTFLRECRE